MEIERKWLITRKVFEGILAQSGKELVDIEQIYLSTLPEVRIRINPLSPETYRLTIKKKTSNKLMRHEIEKPLTKEEYEILGSGLKKLRKRYFKYNEIEASAVNDGQFHYVEVEFDTVEEAENYVFPYKGVEVTGMHRYYMKNVWLRLFDEFPCHNTVLLPFKKYGTVSKEELFSLFVSREEFLGESLLEGTSLIRRGLKDWLYSEGYASEELFQEDFASDEDILQMCFETPVSYDTLKLLVLEFIDGQDKNSREWLNFYIQFGKDALSLIEDGEVEIACKKAFSEDFEENKKRFVKAKEEFKNLKIKGECYEISKKIT